MYWGEIVDEIVGFVWGMKNNMNVIFLEELNVVDICGIGGDGVFMFNILMVSVIVVFVVGVKVVKYGNWVVFFKSGSVDVLEYLDIWI